MFVTVNASGDDIVPLTWEPKPRVGGLIASTAGPTPRPSRPADTEPPGTPATFSEACATPFAVGTNATLTVQVAAAASETPPHRSEPAITWYSVASVPPSPTVSGPLAAVPLFVIVNCCAADA